MCADQVVRRCGRPIVLVFAMAMSCAALQSEFVLWSGSLYSPTLPAGGFFPGEKFVNDAQIRNRSPEIVATVRGPYWSHHLWDPSPTHEPLRKSLAEAAFASDKTAAQFPNGIAALVARTDDWHNWIKKTNPADNDYIVSTLTISIPTSWQSYSIPLGEKETLTPTGISGNLNGLGDPVAALIIGGIPNAQMDVIARTVKYGWPDVNAIELPFFMENINDLADAQLRNDFLKYEAVVELEGEFWKPSILCAPAVGEPMCNAGLACRQTQEYKQLLAAAFHSDKSSADQGFETAMEAKRESCMSVIPVDEQIVGGSRMIQTVKIVIPGIEGFTVGANKFETITTQPAPAITLLNGGTAEPNGTAAVSVLQVRTVTVRARSALFLSSAADFSQQILPNTKDTSSFYPTCLGGSCTLSDISDCCVRNELHIIQPLQQKTVRIKLVGSYFNKAIRDAGNIKETFLRRIFTSTGPGFNQMLANNPNLFTSIDPLVGLQVGWLDWPGCIVLGASTRYRCVEIKVPTIPNYELSAAADEVITPSSLPMSVLDDGLNEGIAASAFAGIREIRILQRNVFFNGTDISFNPSAPSFFRGAAPGKCATPHFNALKVPETNLSVALDIQNMRPMRIKMKLDCVESDFPCEWASDLLTSTAKRHMLIEGLLTHYSGGTFGTTSRTPNGIENPGVRQALKSGHLLEYDSQDPSNRTLWLTIPQLPSYDIPKGVSERVTPETIPGECLHSPSGIVAEPLYQDFTGCFVVDFVANSAFYSGNLFVPEIDNGDAFNAPILDTKAYDNRSLSYVNPEMLERSSRYPNSKPFNVTITLVGPTFAHDIVTNMDKRMRVTRSILAIDGCSMTTPSNPNCSSPFYKYISEDHTNLTRVSGSVLVLTLAPMVGYTLPAMGLDKIVPTLLPEDALVVPSKVEKTGQNGVEVRSRTAHYSGSIFELDNITDHDIRFYRYETRVVLYGEVWNPHGLYHRPQAADPRMYDCMVREAVFSSNRNRSEFHSGISQMAEPFVKMQLLDNHILLLTLDAIKPYRSVPSSFERIIPQSVPGRCVAGATPVHKKAGDFEGFIHARTAVYSGSFYTSCISDGHVRGAAQSGGLQAEPTRVICNATNDCYEIPGNEWVATIDLRYEKWVPDVASDFVKRDAIVQATLVSNKKVSWPDYYLHGFDTFMQAKLLSNRRGSVTRINDTRIEIRLRALPEYILPGKATETITAMHVPDICVVHPEDIYLRDGTFSRVIAQRTALFSGEPLAFDDGKLLEFFYEKPQTTVKHLRTTRYFRIDVTFDDWAPALRTNVTLQRMLLHKVLASNNASLPRGITSLVDNLPIKRWMNLTGKTFLDDNTRSWNLGFLNNHSIILVVPRLPEYTPLPSTSELVSFTGIPAECLASTFDVRVVGAGPYPGTGPNYPGDYAALESQHQTTFFANATAIYSGSFYGIDWPRRPAYLTWDSEDGADTPFELEIQLLDAKWAFDVGTDPKQKQLLLDSVALSNKRMLAPDHLHTGWDAMARVGYGILNGGIDVFVDRINEYTLKLWIPKIIAYALPEGFEEIISAQTIPRKLLLWPTVNATEVADSYDVELRYGYTKLTVRHNADVYRNLGLGRGQWSVQSSTANEVPDGQAYKALDDAFDLTFSMGDCTKTKLQLDPWWRVELEIPMWIRRVSITTPFAITPMDARQQRLGVTVGETTATEGLQNAACWVSTTTTDVAAVVPAGETAYFECAGRTGKYVTIHSTGMTVALRLCEVGIFSAGALLSRSRPTRQSSQHFRFGPERAVDGSREPNLQLGSCTHTLQEESPWWRVALDASMKVQAVVITNRGDAHAERLTGAQIHVSDKPEAAPHGVPRAQQCGEDFAIAAGGTKEIVCDNGFIPGRYVFVVLPGAAKILTLCEVEVYGRPCDRNCYAEYHERLGLAGGQLQVPGEAQNHPHCHELSPTGTCDKPRPPASSQTHVSSWGADH